MLNLNVLPIHRWFEPKIAANRELVPPASKRMFSAVLFESSLLIMRLSGAGKTNPDNVR